MTFRQQIIINLKGTKEEIDALIEYLQPLAAVVGLIEGDLKEIKETEPTCKTNSLDSSL